MNKLTLMPQGVEIFLPKGAVLTELEFELHGQASIPFGCKAGACGACVIEVLDGAENMSTQKDSELAFLSILGYSGTKFRLACQCRLNGTAIIRAASQDDLS